MGASGWGYVTPYKGSVEATLKTLHDEVFQELFGDSDKYRSLDELYADEEFMGEEGTHSILDVHRIVETTEPSDYFTVRPLPTARLAHHFGTDRPTVEHYEDAMDRAYEALRTRPLRDKDTTLLGEHQMRWTGVYVVLYTDSQPTHVGFFGSSGD
ncbi:hypothetical protein EOT10_17970 [Streptomyces antnestii]|uniref:Uncharacterized protein n=2 Tax=Streptomyces antnestii TaxID=2494256 RepID=A0A3S2WJB7_9ACTN|nr:hypothetical protein EOT10_17970 [Streptomyces sp. San01]